MTGIRVRPLDVTSAEELETAHAIVTACELAGVGWTEETLESVTAHLTGPSMPAEEQAFAEVDGEPVGVLMVEFDPHGREVFVDCYAVGDRAPEVLDVLLRRSVSRSRELALASDSSDWTLRAGAYEQDLVYREAMTAVGFAPIRRFWRMRMDLAGRSSVEPAAPAGVTRRVVMTDADRQLLHDLFRVSFADHFGTSLRTPTDEWLAQLAALPGSDPQRWWLAYLDGEPAGLLILDDSKADFDEGYVRTLGVVPAARGGGIARWLLGCAVADAVSRGRASLALSVDGENATGATQLYESVGFGVGHVVDAYDYPGLVEQG